MLKFDCVSLFSEMLNRFVSWSIIGCAIQNELINIVLHNLRNWTADKHSRVDDGPFGGGAGMVMKPEPIFAAVDELRTKNSKVGFLCPDGEVFNCSMATNLSHEKHLILLSGHYEGINERVRKSLVENEILIGDYVLTNVTLASAVLMDTVVRQIPGVLEDENSLNQDNLGCCFYDICHAG
jgi:tRNA (guanine37-N1)-methyltransferase